MGVSRISVAAVRYSSFSSRAAAAISTVTLVTAREARLLREECDIIDYKKIPRSKAKVLRESAMKKSLNLVI